jgi:C_GCAxxG_C_C family probable redox protein
MTPTSSMPVGLPPPSRLGRSALRARGLRNVLRAGHCAPTVMRTLLDATGADAPWLVKLVSGLPGGIGNGGNECGAVTAPLVVLGMRHARAPDEDGVPAVVAKGRALMRAFQASHGSCACRDLLVLGRLPLRCLGIVRLAPERAVEIDGRACAEALSPGERRACAALHAHLVEEGFHCAHAVLREDAAAAALGPDLLDATSAFVGGTAHAGLTCSALVAGVMRLGLAHGASEHRPRRILGAMVGMASGGHAFGEDVAAVNGPMDEGHELAGWFEGEFGSTSCREITGCDLSTEAGVRRYVESDRVSRCRDVARAVAVRVREMTEGD